MKIQNNVLAWFLIVTTLVFIGNSLTGCAQKSQTVRKEVTDNSTGQTTTTVVTEKEVVHEHSDDGGSIVGSVFNVIGEVISFPFRLIAGIFRAVF